MSNSVQPAVNTYQAEIEQLRAENRYLRQQLTSARTNSLNLIYDSIPDAVALIHVSPQHQYCFQLANRVFLQQLEYTATQIDHQPLANVYTPEDYQFLKDKLDQVILTGKVLRYERHLKLPQGESRFEETVMPILDDAGNCSFILLISHDITHQTKREAELCRRNAELEQLYVLRTTQYYLARLSQQYELQEHERTRMLLQRSEDRFYKAFHCSPIPTAILILQDGRFVDVNDHFCRLTGYSRHSILGLRASNLPLWDHAAFLRRFLPVLHAEESIQGMPVQYITRSGDFREGLFFGGAFELEGEWCLLCMIYDPAAEQKTLDQRLQERKHQLEQLQKDFISLVSHEFRTPLTVILSSAELLERYADQLTTEKKTLSLKNIQKQVQYLARLLDDFTAIQEGSTDQLFVLLKSVDVESYTAQLIERVYDRTESSCPIQFSLNLSHHRYRIDKSYYGQLITHLLSNALKFSTQQTSVYLRLWDEPEWLVIEVTDHGIGIPEPDLPYIFQPFFRGSNVGTLRGVGLGLTIVEQILNAYGGTIHLESTAGEGTHVCVRLPLDNTGVIKN
ncbi:MAG: PAS domain-containing sensor histidine kinase [Gemmatimonadetes bacterium]|nr:MAG: PAS domain-containing sensor histidine kinase [Gemmatimonadota bacterium]